MIQDIDPSVFDITYKLVAPKPTDTVLIFQSRQICIHIAEDGAISCPTAEGFNQEDLQFLFTIDDMGYYLYTPCIDSLIDPPEGFDFERISSLRTLNPQNLCFAGMTGHHLYVWYLNNRFCGRCGHETHLSETERALSCVDCGNVIYPRIAPAVIIGVWNEDKLVMSRYAGREYRGKALLAGFCEVGESAEDTVAREVMEEIGIEVTDFRYFGSQPWGMDCNMLFGFFCKPANSTELVIDRTELAEAVWVSRDEIGQENAELSLTGTMMMHFKEHPEDFAY